MLLASFPVCWSRLSISLSLKTKFMENRKFVSDLCDVCESLRFEEDRSKRGEMLESLLAKVHIPACGYLPLCRSTEPFQRVLRITPNEAKAFSTKVRYLLSFFCFLNIFYCKTLRFSHSVYHAWPVQACAIVSNSKPFFGCNISISDATLRKLNERAKGTILLSSDQR